MPEERGLYPKMKVARADRVPRAAPRLLEADADDRAPRPARAARTRRAARDNVETLSLGNQQRAQIAAALVHDPEVLILDEPFSGLDPLAVDVVAGVLQARAADGAAVLFSSHQLDVVERLCDDLVIIAGGTIRASGVARRFAPSTPPVRTGLCGRRRMAAQPGVYRARLRRRLRPCSTSTAPTPRSGAAPGRRPGVDVASFAPQHPSLAQIFKEVIQ